MHNSRGNYKTMRMNSRRFVNRSTSMFNVIMNTLDLIKSVIIVIMTLLITWILVSILSASPNISTPTVGGNQITAYNQLKDYSRTILMEYIFAEEDELYDETLMDDMCIPEIEEVVLEEEMVDSTHEETDEEIVEELLGNEIINLDNSTLVEYSLPSEYYTNLDYSSFQPYMGYQAITNKSSDAYKVVNDEKCYTDDQGFRRYETTDEQFSIDGADDYVIALGTYYKDKGMVGNRYLIVTSNGMYTAITGDEKADVHTDDMNMFTMHDGGTKAGMIEWIVDTNYLNEDIQKAGTVTVGGPDEICGEILHIYEIREM